MRVTKPSGQRTLYHFDEVGNLIATFSESSAAQALPPQLQSVNPDTLLVGQSAILLLSGANLLTTSSVVSERPDVSVRLIGAIDSKVIIALSVSPAAAPGPMQVTVTTAHGSAGIGPSLHRVVIDPESISIFPERTGSLSVRLNPSASGQYTLGILNESPYLFDLLQPSVTIPAGGNAIFSVRGRTAGTGSVKVGNNAASVVVLGSGTSMVSRPVSAGWAAAAMAGTTAAKPVSVGWTAVQSSGTVMTNPVSVKIGID